MTVTPELATVIRDAIESELIDVHTMLPGKVQSVNKLLSTVTVELQLKRTLPTANGQHVTEDLPVLDNVTVGSLRAGNMIVSMPIAKGTTGMVHFAEMSLDQWLSKGANTSPGDIGRHTLTGAVFVPMLVPVKDNVPLLQEDLSEDLVVGELGGTQMRFKPAGACEIISGGNPLAQAADDFVAQAGKTLANLNDAASKFNFHAHLVTATGSPTGSPIGVNPPNNPVVIVPEPVASSNLKAND